VLELMKSVQELRREVRELKEKPSVVREVNAQLGALTISGRSSPPSQPRPARDTDAKTGVRSEKPKGTGVNVWEERKRSQDEFMKAVLESPQALAQVKERMLKEAKERKERAEAFKKLDEVRVRRVIISGITTNLMKADGKTHDDRLVRLFILGCGIVEEARLSEIEKVEVWRLRNDNPNDERARYMIAIQFKTVAFRNFVIEQASTNYILWKQHMKVFGDKSKAERAREFQEKLMREAGNGQRA
jgi:hypothetical protein